MTPPSAEAFRQSEDAAAFSVGFLALLFVALPETFPVFRAWVGDSFAIDHPDLLDPLIENLRKRVMSS